MRKLYLDLETYSETPITHGTHAYAANAEIILFAYALGDDPVQVWDVTAGDVMPSDLGAALLDDDFLICAHNSSFDRTVLRTGRNSTNLTWQAAQQRERWRDTMVKALSHSLPGSLGDLCDILKLGTDKAKDKEGRQLVMLFCKPRPKTSKIRRATRETHPVEWAKFIEYARLDIESMREIDRKLPDWNYRDRELALWHLDQAINDRGVAIDMELVHSSIAAVELAQQGLAKRTQDLTDGDVQAANQKNKDLPANLYRLDKNGFRYRHPIKGTWHGMGTDKVKAVAAARKLNSLLISASDDLVDQVMGSTKTFGEFSAYFAEEVLTARKLSTNTMRQYAGRIDTFNRVWANTPIDQITLKSINEFLDQLPASSSNLSRSLLMDIFSHAVAKGLCPDNQAANILPKVINKQRKRHTL